MNSSIKKRSHLWVFFSGILISVILLAVYLWIFFRGLLITSQTNTQLKVIGLALHHYHDNYGSFPPAIVRDEHGVSIHSWRSLIEPEIAKILSDGNSLTITSYDRTKPWNSLENKTARKPDWFKYADRQFLAIMGPDAAWISDGARTIRDLKDGTSNTILVTAVKGTGIDWHEPRDLVFDGESVTLNGRPFSLSQELLVLLADGTVQHLARGIRPENVKAWVTCNAGDKISPLNDY